MLFSKLFVDMEKARWNLFSDIPWDQFNSDKLSSRQIHGIKMNALLEWAAMPTAEMFLRDNPNDPDFSAFISIWFYEEQKHSLVLLEYLRRFAPEELPSQDDLNAVRFSFDSAPPLESLALHFCGEVRLNQWYKCAQDYHDEPIIKYIYSLLAQDEARHARAYFQYMQRAVSSYGADAKLHFAKIGVLMTNARLNHALHPTNLHVNKELYPKDTVNSRLPDPAWLREWLDKEIKFDQSWEEKVEKGILGNFSALLQNNFSSPADLRQYRKQLETQSA
ncbi:MAG: ferritin [Gammaproteobacteria bacterium]|nr:MAG: ferritin [Gammaproteobacteria bacterium]